MNDWLDDFQALGTRLNEGEKTLMRFAMSKERERINQIVQDWFDYDGDTSEGSKNLLEWIDEEYDE